MKGYVDNIEKVTVANDDFRRVLYTGKNLQLVLMTLKAGEVLFIPAKTIHAARNVGTGNGAELATYIVEKGKQLVVFVK